MGFLLSWSDFSAFSQPSVRKQLSLMPVPFFEFSFRGAQGGGVPMASSLH